jgi:hypothetical protein
MNKVDVSVEAFFRDQGWEPPYTKDEYEAEVSRRVKCGSTRKEAECALNEKIMKDLEEFTALAFAQDSSLMS